MDIIILQETWSRADASPTAHPTTEKSSYHHKNSTQSDREETQRSNNLVQIKIPQPHQHSKAGKYYTWLKSTRNCSLIRKRYIPVCYISRSASESPYYKRRHFLHIREETSHFQAQGNVLICGDLNARTGLQPDFTDHKGANTSTTKLTVINNTFLPIHRNNHDHQ